MVELRYKAPMLQNVSENELKMWSKALLLKIHVITGWVIPDNEMLNILLDQFEKKLVEDYADMNSEEIEYAFRRKGTSVKDWGKSMNLSLIDTVLLPYVSERSELFKAVERKEWNKGLQQVIYTTEQLLNMQRGHVEQSFQCMRKGIVPVLHGYVQETLEMDGFLQKGEMVSDFFVRALNSGWEKLYIYEPEEKAKPND